MNKTLGGGLQSIDYLYNQRGWLRQINQPLDLFTPPVDQNTCITNSIANSMDMMQETFCGSVVVDVPELLSIRFNPDVNVDCYNPCANSYLVAGTPADCPASLLDNNPTPQGLYTQTVQLPCPDGSFQNETRPDLSNLPLPTTLYRIRFCNGEERYVFQAELNTIEANSILILQTIEVTNHQQLFQIREDCGHTQAAGLDALVVLIAHETPITVNDYVVADICDPQQPNCTDAEQQLQQAYIEDLKAANRKVEDLDFPTYFIRVLLCGGTEVYLSLDEIQNLPGNYIELQRIFIENQQQTFQVGSTLSSNDTEDLFYLSLHYDDVGSGIGNTPLYNGNISYLTWQVAGANEQIYKFTYDNLDRITSATFGERNTSDLDFNNLYNATFSNYDANGNIGKIKRKGPALPNFGCAVDIDDLTLAYTGNRLNTVADATTNATDRLRGFKATTTSSLTYGYDFNGNLITDPHKNLTISYNYLNLPKLFNFGSGNVMGITYTSEGQKLQKAVAGSEASLKDYCDGVEYGDRALEAVYHSEGRVVRSGGNWDFEWFVRDHLGSIIVKGYQWKKPEYCTFR